MNNQARYKKRLSATVASTVAFGVSLSSTATQAETFSNKLLLTGGVSQV